MSGGSLYSLLGTCSKEQAFAVYQWHSTNAVLRDEVLFSWFTGSLLLCCQLCTYSAGGGMRLYASLPFQIIYMQEPIQSTFYNFSYII